MRRDAEGLILGSHTHPPPSRGQALAFSREGGRDLGAHKGRPYAHGRLHTPAAH